LGSQKEKTEGKNGSRTSDSHLFSLMKYE
jgi:hypothetical protein